MYTEVKNNLPHDSRFAPLGMPNRVWAISAIHAETEKLAGLHDELYERLQPGDSIVYTGNYYGFGHSAAETIDEILTFQRMVTENTGLNAEDITYLRGGQEEMWQKLLQVAFAPDPAAVLTWMFDHGMAHTLCSYGISPEDGLAASRQSIPALTKWTNRIRTAIRYHAGHEAFMMKWVRAAYTHNQTSYPLLFVHAGINPAKPLAQQGDALWWAGKNFNSIELPYNPFQKVIRGYDPNHGGMNINCVTATIDGGCGFGGSLVCSGIDSEGHIFEIIEA